MSQTTAPARQLIIIDSQINNWQSLAGVVSADALMLILDSASDGLTQISNYLTILLTNTGGQDFLPLQSIHIVSHGSMGSLLLGSSIFTNSNLGLYNKQLATLGRALSATGDLLLYGCNVAQGSVGQAFISAFANATSADVAASTDFTGTILNGGNWTLEATIGVIEAQSLASVDFTGTLEVLTGTTEADVLEGGMADDTLSGLTGNDRLNGYDGNDTLNGGAGADTLTGGLGDDTYIVDSSNDKVIEIADQGFDTIKTGLTSYSLATDALAGVENLEYTGNNGVIGNFIGTGNAEDNLILGNTGKDTLNGGEGDDTLNGGGNDDKLLGGEGDDQLNGGQGNDIIDGGDGDDFIDGGTGIDNLKGGSGDDTLVYDAQDASIYGGAGDNDVLLVKGGSINSGLFAKGLITGIETVRLTKADGSYAFDFHHSPSAPFQFLWDGLPNPNKTGYWVVTIIENHDKTISSIVADAASKAGEVDAVILVGKGAGTLEGGIGNQFSWFATDGGGDALFSQHPTGGLLFYHVAHDLNTRGTAGVDSLYGGFGDDVLLGYAGNDTLNGSFGNDKLDGGVGNDTLNGGVGYDTLNGETGNDTLNGGVGNDKLEGGLGGDTLNGNDGDDTLDGGAGNDKLDGGAGVDVLLGGSGNDTLSYDIADSKIDGGAGIDKLKIIDSGITLDLSLLTLGKITGIEKLDLTGIDKLNINGSANNSLLVNETSLLKLTGPDGHNLYVTGDAGDSVTVATHTGAMWTDMGVSNITGVNYHQYIHITGTVTDHLYVLDTLIQNLV